MMSGMNGKKSEYKSEEEETKSTKMDIFARQIMENDYDNVDVPTFERYNVN